MSGCSLRNKLCSNIFVKLFYWKSDMIPKQLFFIWIGKEVPIFVNYCIDAFRNQNQNFCIDLIHYTNDDIVNCQDSVINYVKNLIFKSKKGIRNKYYEYINHRIASKFNFIQILSDVIRFEYLYYYGGIYLDCDTFPVRPFDDKLLSLTNFAQNVLCFKRKDFKPKTLNDDTFEGYDDGFIKNPKDYVCYVYQDIYFLGARKEYSDSEIYFNTGVNCANGLNPPWLRNLELSPVFIEYRKRFYEKCDLVLYKDFIFYTHYITHFCSKKWQTPYKESPMYCEYDDYLYGDSKC